MKFNVERAVILSELSHLIRVTEKKSSIPILSTVLISASSDSIRLVTTDLDVALVTDCPADIIEPGAAVLSCRKLFDIVRSLPDLTISFRYKAQGSLTEISCAGSEFKLSTTAKEHYPETASPPKRMEEVSASVLQSLIERTVYAVTLEESRYTLAGSLFQSEGEVRRMVATDGHRLSIVESPAKNGSKQCRILIPRKCLIEAAVLAGARAKEIRDKDSSERASKEDREVRFAFDENHVFFEFGHRLLISRLLNGQFPNYDLVIPKKNRNVVSVATRALTQALSRVSLMADERSHGVKLELSKGVLTVSTQSVDVGEAKEAIAVDYEGETVDIGFNAHYCLDFLATVSAERVKIALDGGESPALFSPEGDDDYRYVVMPMRTLLPTPQSRDAKGPPGRGTRERDGLLPTPTANEDKHRDYYRGAENPSLTGAVRMLPSPTSADSHGRDYTYDQGDRGSKGQPLARQVLNLLPTPRSNKRGFPDSHGNTEAWNCGGEATSNPSGPNDSDTAPARLRRSPKRERLSVSFGLWMMGFPLDWLDLSDGLKTERKQSKRSGTRSSRRSSTKSSKR